MLMMSRCMRNIYRPSVFCSLQTGANVDKVSDSCKSLACERDFIFSRSTQNLRATTNLQFLKIRQQFSYIKFSAAEQNIFFAISLPQKESFTFWCFFKTKLRI